MEQNLEVTGAAAAASCFKRRFQNLLSTVTYLPCHRQADASVKNLQPTFRITLDLCKNIPLAVLFVATVIHTQSLRSHIYIYIYIYMCVCVYTQSVTGGTDQTSGGCSLC